MMKFYRYENIATQNSYINYNGDMESTGSFNIEIILKVFSVVKETPEGYWLVEDAWAGLINPKEINFKKNKLLKWIGKNSQRRFAHSTKEEALKSFKIRKRNQIKILSDQLEFANVALKRSENVEL